MRHLWLFGASVLLVACREATTPRAFTLGPGCWTRTATPLLDDVTGKRIGTLIVDGHYAMCPDPLPTGHVLLHWDTTWVSH